MLKYPSTGQYRDAVKWQSSYCNYHNVPTPTVTFEGTCKLHGSNLSLTRPIAGTANDIVIQSRERIISVESDNAGAAVWSTGNRATLNDIFDRVATAVKADFPSDTTLQIVGEWCGGNIQKGVGLNQLPKMFVVFAIRIAVDPEDAGKFWLSKSALIDAVAPSTKEDLFHSYQFPTWTVDVDFNRPDIAQNRIAELTQLVEDRCPVSHQLLGDRAVGELIGEGLVWTPVAPDGAVYHDIRGLRFKSKGDKHSVSKVKTIASVDPEKFDNVEKFVDATCTVNRMEQGLEKLREKGLELDVKNTGEYLKWISQDIAREEADTLFASNLTMKDVGGKISGKARLFFMAAVNESVGVQ